jgi:hypothetical protein
MARSWHKEQVLGLHVQDVVLHVQDLGYNVQDLGIYVQDLGHNVQDLGRNVHDLGIYVQELGLHLQGTSSVQILLSTWHLGLHVKYLVPKGQALGIE